jgi:hypothetical protein
MTRPPKRNQKQALQRPPSKPKIQGQDLLKEAAAKVLKAGSGQAGKSEQVHSWKKDNAAYQALRRALKDDTEITPENLLRGIEQAGMAPEAILEVLDKQLDGSGKIRMAELAEELTPAIEAIGRRTAVQSDIVLPLGDPTYIGHAFADIMKYAHTKFAVSYNEMAASSGDMITSDHPAKASGFGRSFRLGGIPVHSPEPGKRESYEAELTVVMPDQARRSWRGLGHTSEDAIITAFKTMIMAPIEVKISIDDIDIDGQNGYQAMAVIWMNPEGNDDGMTQIREDAIKVHLERVFCTGNSTSRDEAIALALVDGLNVQLHRFLGFMLYWWPKSFLSDEMWGKVLGSRSESEEEFEQLFEHMTARIRRMRDTSDSRE